MGFWIFLVCMNLLIPLAMLGFGAVFLRWPPKEINGVYGYRTARSMASQEAWDFAHAYFGRLWIRTGLAMALLSVPAMLPSLGKSDGVVSLWGIAVCIVECVLMILPIIPTEWAIKKRFPDKSNPEKRL